METHINTVESEKNYSLYSIINLLIILIEEQTSDAAKQVTNNIGTELT